MNQPLIYLGACPVCEGGLCRIRICGVASNDLHALAICDECEAMWSAPDLAVKHQFSSAEKPVSPRTGEPIWSPENRWASVEDVCLLGWYEHVYIERPT